MAINFPDSPNNGDIYTVNGKRWIYEDGKWASYGEALAPDVLKVDSVNNRVGVNNLSPAVALDVVGSVDVSGSLTVDGDITVSGNTTTLNTTELYVEDNKITLNSGATGSATVNAGIEVERGDDPNVEILWDETADAWKIATDFTVDTDTFHVDSANNRVGIGTTSPAAPLHVSSTGGEGVRIQKSNNDQEGSYISMWDDDERLGYVGFGGDDDLYVKNQAAAGKIYLDTDGAGTALTIDSSGNVGIGTTSPTGDLDIHGNTSTLVFTSPSNTNRYRIDANMTDAADYGLSIGYWDGAAYQRTLTVDDGGNVGIGTALPGFLLDVAGQAVVGAGDNITPNAFGNGHFMIDGNGYTGFASLDGAAMWVGHNSNSRSLYLTTDETARVTVTGTGYVGIGTTSPASTAPYENYILTLTGGGWYGYDTMNMINTYARVTADATLDDTPGLLLNNTGANTTNHSTPGLWFTSTDSAFTTTKPKYLAGIVGRASETYNSDTKGGMYIQMYLSGNSPGAADVLPGTSYGYTFGQSSFYHFTDNGASLGISARRWAVVYAVSGSINTSDVRDKTDIADLDYGLDFVNSLRPVKYRYADRDVEVEGVRTHMGFIAQEVKEVLGEDAPNRGVWTSSEFETTGELDDDDNPIYTDVDRQGLRYSELIAPMVKAIQELTARIEALEAG